MATSFETISSHKSHTQKVGVQCEIDPEHGPQAGGTEIDPDRVLHAANTTWNTKIKRPRLETSAIAPAPATAKATTGARATVSFSPFTEDPMNYTTPVMSSELQITKEMDDWRQPFSAESPASQINLHPPAYPNHSLQQLQQHQQPLEGATDRIDWSILAKAMEDDIRDGFEDFWNINDDQSFSNGSKEEDEIDDDPWDDMPEVKQWEESMLAADASSSHKKIKDDKHSGTVENTSQEDLIPFMEDQGMPFGAMSEERYPEEVELLRFIRSPRDLIKLTARSELVDSLLETNGDMSDNRFVQSLNILSQIYAAKRRSPEEQSESISNFINGNWRSLSRPSYRGTLGNTAKGDFIYPLGMLSFDMFKPGFLKCSLQHTLNTIKQVCKMDGAPSAAPWSLRRELAMYDPDADHEDQLQNDPNLVLKSYE
jgi:hypothetical protein